MSVISGKNVVLSINRGGTYYAVACNSVCAMKMDRDFLETTFRDSGDIRTYVPFKGTISITGSGPIEFDASFTAQNVVDLWANAELIQWSFELTDDKGHSTISKEYTGYGYFKSVSLTGDVQQAASCDYEIIVSNDITGIDGGIIGGNLTNFYTLEYDATGGETFISDDDWIGATIMEVLRNGVGLELITSGTPTGSQALINDTTNIIEFGLALGAGEYIQVIWGK